MAWVTPIVIDGQLEIEELIEAKMLKSKKKKCKKGKIKRRWSKQTRLDFAPEDQICPKLALLVAIVGR